MSFFAELKRRNVFKVSMAYLALGWSERAGLNDQAPAPAAVCLRKSRPMADTRPASLPG